MRRPYRTKNTHETWRYTVDGMKLYFANLALLCVFAVNALAVKNYHFAKVGCRPPGGNVRYSALEAEHVRSRLSADATARRSVAYLSFFPAKAVNSLFFNRKERKGTARIIAISYHPRLFPHFLHRTARPITDRQNKPQGCGTASGLPEKLK